MSWALGRREGGDTGTGLSRSLVTPNSSGKLIIKSQAAKNLLVRYVSGLAWPEIGQFVEDYELLVLLL